MKNTLWTLLAETNIFDATAMPGIHPIVGQLLWNRGLRTEQEARAFLEPSYERDIHNPFLFRHMQRAVDRLHAAILNKELIIVHGDYDADGISASAILTHALRTLGANVDGFIPHREFDGYGVKITTIDTLAARGAKVIITCDCGISNAPEIAHANTLGIDVDRKSVV